MGASVSAASTLASVAKEIGTVFTAAIGWVGTVADTITAQPLLLFGVVVSFVGIGVGLFKRLLHV